MSTQTTPISYKRAKSTGTLTLAGAIDIFEAGVLHAEACKALDDGAASEIHINFNKTERLDASAIQLFLALKRDGELAGKRLRVTPPSERVRNRCENLGIHFD